MAHFSHQHPTDAGFSAIELLVSLFVAAALVLGFYQLFNVIDHGNTVAKNNITANNLALSNLNRFPSKPAGMPSCPGSQTRTIGNDGEIKLPGSVVQKVDLSYASSSCPGVNPIKVISSVTYGPSTDRITIKQVTYVSQD